MPHQCRLRHLHMDLAPFVAAEQRIQMTCLYQIINHGSSDHHHTVNLLLYDYNPNLPPRDASNCSEHMLQVLEDHHGWQNLPKVLEAEVQSNQLQAEGEPCWIKHELLTCLIRNCRRWIIYSLMRVSHTIALNFETCR